MAFNGRRCPSWPTRLEPDPLLSTLAVVGRIGVDVTERGDVKTNYSSYIIETESVRVFSNIEANNST